MTELEAKTCDNVPKEGQKGFDPHRPGKSCGAIGKIYRTGKKARFGCRFVKCPKCDALWQVTFKKTPPEEISRTPSQPKA